MSQKFYEMQAEVKASSMQPAAPRAKTMYLVGAWNAQGGYWKVHRESNIHEFTTREAAETFGARLSAAWSHVQIIEVPFPGVEQQKGGE